MSIFLLSPIYRSFSCKKTLPIPDMASEQVFRCLVLTLDYLDRRPIRLFFFPIKVQRGNSVDFAGRMVLVTTELFCSDKDAVDMSKQIGVMRSQ